MDALTLRAYELIMTVGYMLRSRMIDAMGADSAQAAVDEAGAVAADEASDELRWVTELV